MKTRLFFTLIFVSLFSCLTVQGEENTSSFHHPSFSFYEYVSKPNDSDLKNIEVDGLVDGATAFFEQKLKECTFTYEEMVPGETLRRAVTHKIEIYNAVKNIHKQLKKDVEEDPTLRSQASRTMNMVVRVGLAAFYDDNSGQFEEEIHKCRKDYKKVIELFKGVVLK